MHDEIRLAYFYLKRFREDFDPQRGLNSRERIQPSAVGVRI